MNEELSEQAKIRFGILIIAKQLSPYPYLLCDRPRIPLRSSELLALEVFLFGPIRKLQSGFDWKNITKNDIARSRLKWHDCIFLKSLTLKAI